MSTCDSTYATLRVLRYRVAVFGQCVASGVEQNVPSIHLDIQCTEFTDTVLSVVFYSRRRTRSSRSPVCSQFHPGSSPAIGGALTFVAPCAAQYFLLLMSPRLVYIYASSGERHKFMYFEGALLLSSTPICLCGRRPVRSVDEESSAEVPDSH